MYNGQLKGENWRVIIYVIFIIFNLNGGRKKIKGKGKSHVIEDDPIRLNNSQRPITRDYSLFERSIFHVGVNSSSISLCLIFFTVSS